MTCFSCGSVSVWNLVSDIKGKTQTEGVWEQDAEEDILDRRGMKWQEVGENCMRCFITFIIRMIKSRRIRLAEHVARIGNKRHRSVDNIRMDLIKENWMVWIGLIWLMRETSGRLLRTRYWTFGFHEMLGSSWVAAQLMAPQDGLSSVSKLSSATILVVIR
jgi:hypothetical protein